MNKKTFRTVSRYSLIVTLVVIVLTASAIIVSIPRPAATKPLTLNTDSTSSLSVQSANAGNTPTVSRGGSGNATSSGSVSLQPATQEPGTGSTGVGYPCNSCPAAPDATDIMICSDYCTSPLPEPSPTPGPYPACDPCHNNTYSTSGKPLMCPMIACRFAD